MSQQLIVGFGEALVDVLPSGEVVGGAPLNFSVRAAEFAGAFDCRAALVTRIGADQRGERILERLHASQLDTCGVQVDSELQTGYVDVRLEAGQPSYTIGEGVAWDEIRFDESVAELALQTDTVCFGTLVQRTSCSRETLYRFLDTARSATRILDLNFRTPYPSAELIERSLQAADIMKCNADELLLLAQWLRLDALASPVAIAAELQAKYHFRSVFWTRGAEGCRWQDGETIIDGDVPNLPTSPDADSVGAGDAASAALAIGVTLGWSPERIVASANLCGAYAASQRGPTVPMQPEILERLKC